MYEFNAFENWVGTIPPTHLIVWADPSICNAVTPYAVVPVLNTYVPVILLPFANKVFADTVELPLKFNVRFAEALLVV